MRRSRSVRALIVGVSLVALGCGGTGQPGAVEAPAAEEPAAPAPDAGMGSVPEEDGELPPIDTGAWDAAADAARIQDHFDGLAAAFDGGAEAGFAALGRSHRPELTAQEYVECLFGEGETFENLDAEGYRFRIVWGELAPDPEYLASDGSRPVEEGFRVYFGPFTEYETFAGEESPFEFEDSVAIHPDGRVAMFTCDVGGI